MIFANTLLALAAAAGASAQRCRFGNCNGGGVVTTPAPEPTPAPPPPPAGATQVIWGQCGGVDWEYATACPDGAYCYNDGENEWYSQCVPQVDDDEGAGIPVLDDPNVETRIITTIFDVPGPTPTVVTTYITIFTQAPEPTPPPQQHVTITAVPDSPIGRRWSA